jgi:hypothetical protein
MSLLVSSRREVVVAVKTGGAWGGLRRFAGAMVAVVSKRVFVALVDQVGSRVVDVLVGLKWFTREERREVGGMRKNGGARMRVMPMKTTATKEKRRGRVRKQERARLRN